MARAHTKKGTGLGLAICAWIADLHKGRVEVKSDLGQGSTFTCIAARDSSSLATFNPRLISSHHWLLVLILGTEQQAV